MPPCPTPVPGMLPAPPGPTPVPGNLPGIPAANPVPGPKPAPPPSKPRKAKIIYQVVSYHKVWIINAINKTIIIPLTVC